MNTPVNFELAKLLKEKGFDVSVRTAWYIDEVGYWKIPMNHNQSNVKYSAPTTAEVIMWLYKKYGIWISVIDKNTDQTEWEFQTSKKGIGLVFSSGQYPPKFYNSPTEAYEAAIEYCLTNLIK